jgi:hypothetical protein
LIPPINWDCPEKNHRRKCRITANTNCSLLIVAYQHEDDTSLSLMYLARAKGLPSPSSEVKGILLLKKEEVYRLCQEPTTLEQYLSRGGKAILKADFDKKLLLEPFAQLRLLSKILNIQNKGFYAAKVHI